MCAADGRDGDGVRKEDIGGACLNRFVLELNTSIREKSTGNDGRCGNLFEDIETGEDGKYIGKGYGTYDGGGGLYVKCSEETATCSGVDVSKCQDISSCADGAEGGNISINIEITTCTKGICELCGAVDFDTCICLEISLNVSDVAWIR